MKSKITAKLIAPCGMNCALCLGFQREKNKCDGCRSDNSRCVKCSIVNCKNLNNKFCFTCEKFPCRRMKQLDKRYRTKYGMSMIENLEYIKRAGIREFVNKEKKRWKCKKCGVDVCVHRDKCLLCGHIK